MKKVQLHFSSRDWKRGVQLLMQLGHLEEENWSDQHDLELEEAELESLEHELDHLDLEWRLEDL